MKLVVVKNKKQKERLINTCLKKKGRVVAVVSSPKDLKNELIKKADVVILENHEEDSGN